MEKIIVTGKKSSSSSTNFMYCDQGVQKIIEDNLNTEPYIIGGNNVYSMGDLMDRIKQHLRCIDNGLAISITMNIEESK